MCLILVFGTLAQNSLWNASVRSRLATVQSLVERGTFRIDESEFSDTIDKVYVNGHFYSDKPPLLAVLGAAPYYVLRTFAGRRGALGKSADALITLSTMGIGFVLGIICFYDGLKRIGIPREYRLIMTASLGLATIYGVWNLTFNNNGFAASWLFIGFYCLLRARQTGHRNLWLFLSGLSLSMAGAVDNPTTLFFVAFAVYVLAIRELRSGFLFYALPVLITFLPSGLINYAISGSIRPVQLNPEYFRYPGSYWLTGREALSGVKYNSPGFALRYGFYCLFGPQGFLLYNPLQLIALWYLVRGIASRGLLWMEGAIVLGVFSSTAFYYFISTTNYGGYSYSIRWLVPAIPLLWFFAFGFFENFTRAKRMVFTGLFAMSMVIAAVGAGNPWAKTENGRAGFLVNVESIGSRIHQFEAKWRAHS
jgi:4-amino-4-deoxy-L-arabinose transferase-like glycosyltransferase